MIGRSRPDDRDQSASDSTLVARCLAGDEQAWVALLDRYKRLIYSIPLKYGASSDEAAEILQAVSVDLVTELPRLRKPEAVKWWLVSVTRHKALRWKTQARRATPWDEAGDLEGQIADPAGTAVVDEVEQEQAVRDAVRALPDRCRQLVQFLFFEQPPLPYADVAARLGLAVGSIGFIRGRCLNKLRAELTRRGF